MPFSCFAIYWKIVVLHIGIVVWGTTKCRCGALRFFLVFKKEYLGKIPRKGMFIAQTECWLVSSILLVAFRQD